MKKALKLTIIAVVLHVLPALADDDDTRARQLSPEALQSILDGYESYQIGNYVDALNSWKPYINMAPHQVQYLYSRILAEGLVNKGEVITILKESSEHKHPEAIYLIGLAQRATGQTEDGLKNISIAASLKWPEAYYALGQFYEAGDSLDLDLIKALAYYKLAVAAGVSIASIKALNLSESMTENDVDAASELFNKLKNN